MECVAGSGVARDYVPEEDHQIVMASLVCRDLVF
jgi:hypothetical protein